MAKAKAALKLVKTDVVKKTKKPKAKETTAPKVKKINRKFFTLASLKEEDIQAPPVPGCECAYCRCMRLYHYASAGDGASPSHRVPGGDEKHNPENVMRLALEKAIPQAEFQRYVSKRGGHQIWFQGASGLWYCSGRTPVMHYVGHYVEVFQERGYDELKKENLLATLCLPPKEPVPLAGVVMTHYLSVTSDELYAWGVAASTLFNKKPIPKALLATREARYGV